MSQEKILAMPNITTPSTPVIFNADICDGCNTCVEACQIDVFIPNPEEGKPPIILHPDECWYGGCCVHMCPRPGAIQFNWPLELRPYWKNKNTGEVHQI
jgi:NAD-dependent dihydropyrimidine dehydrogenase PreA subunit